MPPRFSDPRRATNPLPPPRIGSPAPLSNEEIDRFVRPALAEDTGTGDLTSIHAIPERARARARLVAKAEGVVAGLAVFARTFELCDRAARIEMLAEDGARCHPRQELVRIEGSARALLGAERTALNFVQRLSGIATLTARYVALARGGAPIDAARSSAPGDAARSGAPGEEARSGALIDGARGSGAPLASARGGAPGGVRVLDTRKTTPGLRQLEKYAVRCGGGENHRFGLFDEVMLKENHIELAGRPIADVLRDLRRALGANVRITCEARDEREARAGIEGGADVILLDNMTAEELARLAPILRGLARQAGRELELEASGGIDERTIAAVARTGVDRVSVGALTHSAPALDLALDLEPIP